jgi:hypothetical protein
MGILPRLEALSDLERMRSDRAPGSTSIAPGDLGAAITRLRELITVDSAPSSDREPRWPLASAGAGCGPRWPRAPGSAGSGLRSDPHRHDHTQVVVAGVRTDEARTQLATECDRDLVARHLHEELDDPPTTAFVIGDDAPRSAQPQIK